MSSGKSNCEISQQIEGFDVFSGVIGNVEFQGIRGIRNDDSTVLKEKNREGTKMMMEQEIISLLGGRAAEELVIKDITTGASNDIKRAT